MLWVYVIIFSANIFFHFSSLCVCFSSGMNNVCRYQLASFFSVFLRSPAFLLFSLLSEWESLKRWRKTGKQEFQLFLLLWRRSLQSFPSTQPLRVVINFNSNEETTIFLYIWKAEKHFHQQFKLHHFPSSCKVFLVEKRKKESQVDWKGKIFTNREESFKLHENDHPWKLHHPNFLIKQI